MNAPEKGTNKAGMADYLAAERTLLAWIRTGLALMGFGFVVARFGIFLSEIQFAQNRHPVGSYGVSIWFGTGLIASGVFVSISAGLRHLRIVRELDRGGEARPHSSKLAIFTALFLALIGIGMTIYLISVHS
jgi:putative membrane protein